MLRRILALVVALSLVAAAFALTDYLLSTIPGVTRRHAQRIEAGMSKQQVKAILGVPRGGIYWSPRWPPSDDGAHVGVWEGPSGRVSVHFDGSDRVTESRFEGWRRGLRYVFRCLRWARY